MASRRSGLRPREPFSIVTKDADLGQRSFLFGHPPKVIWLRVGNCSTKRIETLLRGRAAQVAEFLADGSRAFLASS
jgi:predicted nuclease of predicted toxin-antitoxin system